MQKFPKIEIDQVVIGRSEASTGHILDEKLSLVLNDEQKVYTVCDSIEEAVIVCKSLMTENKNVECCIFNSSNSLLYFFHSLNDFDEL